MYAKEVLEFPFFFYFCAFEIWKCKLLIFYRMKKLLLALVALAFLFSACNKEGVYTPKKKLSAVYLQGSQPGTQRLVEEYVWDGDLLKEKLFYASLVDGFLDNLDFVPIYDGKRVVRVDEKLSGEYVDYFYDGRLLTHLTYHFGDWVSEVDIEHKGGKISKISFHADTLMDNGGAEKLLAKFVSQTEMNNINKILKQNSKYMGGGSMSVDLSYTWKGDNVAQATLGLYQFGELVIKSITDYQYDEMLNPYAIAWVDCGSEFQLVQNAVEFRLLSMSKNNFTQYKREEIYYISGEESLRQEYVNNVSYEYEGKYPVKSVQSCHYMDEPISEEVFYYEYK